MILEAREGNEGVFVGGLGAFLYRVWYVGALGGMGSYISVHALKDLLLNLLQLS